MAHIQCSFFSPALQKNANAMVFIPTVSADDYLGDEPMPDYCAADKKYQTLYLLHGSYGDCNDWVHLASVERYAQEACLAVVMPSGENS
ncbi:MAG: acetylesterase, partial [Ruthenibacterium sp.]